MAAPRERESSNQPTEQVLGILPPALVLRGIRHT
jgi:hypothetical protein